MIEISILAVFVVLKFLLVWFCGYMVLLIVRFGSNISWRSELIAAAIALIPPILMFTDLVKFRL